MKKKELKKQNELLKKEIERLKKIIADQEAMIESILEIVKDVRDKYPPFYPPYYPVMPYTPDYWIQPYTPYNDPYGTGYQPLEEPYTICFKGRYTSQ